MVLLLVDDTGMSTVEYAIGTIAAAAFGAILYTVVTGDSIVTRADEHHQPSAEHQRLTGDRGAATVEAAFAIAALVVVLVLCAGGLTALSMQVRCIDAAREAARLAARGDDDGRGASRARYCATQCQARPP